VTRDEYVSSLKAKGAIIDDDYVVHRGDREPRVILPCKCDYEDCDGWAMVPLDGVADHVDDLLEHYREQKP